MQNSVITPQTQPTLLPEPKLPHKTRLIQRLKAALLVIVEANVKHDADLRARAIGEYSASHQRSLDAGIRPPAIRKKCEASCLKSLVACLRAVAWATVDGDETLRDLMADWYEDDRQRMINAGFRAFSVAARASSQVWKGIR